MNPQPPKEEKETKEKKEETNIKALCFMFYFLVSKCGLFLSSKIWKIFFLVEVALKESNSSLRG